MFCRKQKRTPTHSRTSFCFCVITHSSSPRAVVVAASPSNPYKNRTHTHTIIMQSRAVNYNSICIARAHARDKKTRRARRCGADDGDPFLTRSRPKSKNIKRINILLSYFGARAYTSACSHYDAHTQHNTAQQSYAPRVCVCRRHYEKPRRKCSHTRF